MHSVLDMRDDISDVRGVSDDSRLDIRTRVHPLDRQGAELMTAIAAGQRGEALGTLQKTFEVVTKLADHPERGHYTRNALRLLYARIDETSAAFDIPFDIPEEELRVRGLGGTLSPL